MLAGSEIERALVITAHPDDVDYGAGGTIAAWTAAGIAVTYCVITDGDAGGFDEAVPRAEIPRIRRAEQRAAGAALGVHDVRFLGYPDGKLEVSLPLRRELSRVIRQVRPQRVMCQSPIRTMARIHASHPDHLAAAEAALCAVYPDARNPFAHPSLVQEEGLSEWVVPEVWLMGGPAPDHYVDVTATFARKLAALRAHESQTAHQADLETMLRGWLGRNASAAGAAEGTLLEAFQVCSTG